MRIIRLALFLSTIGFWGAPQFFGAVGSWDDGVPAKDKLNLLKKANPGLDVEEAIQNKDYRCVGIVIGGYVGKQEIPGASAEQCKEHGVKNIALIGGDVINGEYFESLKLAEPARKYAEQYNRLLFKKLTR